jgi:hypothetical protein
MQSYYARLRQSGRREKLGVQGAPSVGLVFAKPLLLMFLGFATRPGNLISGTG